MLGTDVCSVLEENHEVYGYDIGDFDIVDAGRTMRTVMEVRPDVIVHAAAFTDVEACEDERERAFSVNATGTMNVAEASRQTGSLLVYISTDYVFDGSGRVPYRELDAPNPINYYGLTKLHGEKHVRKLAPRYLIVRTSWLFGPNGRNFVDTIIEKASRDGRVRVVADQKGCPTYTLDLAVGIGAVIDKGLEGILHLTSSGEATWFDLAECAIETAGIDAEVRPVETSAFPTKAKRPPYSVLASDVLEGAGLDPLPAWEEGVKGHLIRRGVVKVEGS